MKPLEEPGYLPFRNSDPGVGDREPKSSLLNLHLPPENAPYRSLRLIDCDQTEALPLVHNTGFKTTAEAVRLMVDDLVLLPSRIPHTWKPVCRERNPAWNPHEHDHGEA